MTFRNAVLVTLLASASSLLAATNSWKGSSGTWDTKSDWSLNQLPTSTQDIVITNSGTFAVTMDDRTPSTAKTILTFSMSNSVGASVLSVTNRPSSTSSMTFTILRDADVGIGSTLDVVSITNVGRIVTVKASNFFNNGYIFLRSNTWLTVTNNFSLGTKPNQIGVFTNFGGNVTARNLTLGSANGAQGIWSVLGGTNLVGDTLQIGSETGTGIVNQLGGKLIVGGTASDYGFSIAGSANSTGIAVVANGHLQPNGSIAVGERGFGTFIISNGTLQVGTLDIGVWANGIWKVAGGTNTINSLAIGENSGATGEVWITGGTVHTGELGVGGILRGYGSGCGQGSLIISNGSLTVDYTLGIGDCSVGAMTIAGGFVESSFLSLGEGILRLTGGELVVTGGSYSGRVDFRGFEGTQLVCSGGIFNVRQLDLGYHAPQQSWEISMGTSIVQQVANIARGICKINGGRLQVPLLEVGQYPNESASVIISGGEAEVTQWLNVGTADRSIGLVNVMGGSLTVSTRVDVAASAGSTGIVSVAGGTLKLANGAFGFEYPASIGAGGAGELNVSSGSFLALSAWVGGSARSVGTLTVSGGLVDTATGGFGTTLIVGKYAGSTGVVSYTGGNLHTRTITLGDAGFGSMRVFSNADFQPLGVIVGNQSGAVGVLSIQGGTFSGSATRQIYDMQIGVAQGSTGTMWITDGALGAGSFGSCFPGGGIAAIGLQGSGRLSATNSTVVLYNLSIGNKGTLECVNSRFYVPGGNCALINSNTILFINSSGSFSTSVQNTGTIVANGSTVTFGGVLNNSGTIIATNAVVQFSGGISNTGNVVLGPNQFRITSVQKSGDDIIVNWQAFSGNRYRVQTAANQLTTYTDISPEIVAAGNGLSITNFIHAGALTNSAPRFYRVRQLF
jgi:hypothetical protein